MRCKDGSYLSGIPSPALCDSRGGMAAIYHDDRPPQPPRRP